MSTTSPSTEFGVYTPDQFDRAVTFFRQNGFVIIRGLYDDQLMEAMEAECIIAQHKVMNGTLDDKHGTVILVDDSDGQRTERFANYVIFIEQLSAAVRQAIADPLLVTLMHELLGDECWVDDNDRFGVVYQDARPGRASAYTRIGWHSDWQSGPNLRVWPSVAFTFHIDATSPDNGFLRVVPGSHLWATPAPYENVNGAVVPAGSAPAAGHTDEPPPFPMPLRFEKVPGEIAVYAERGDLVLHDAYLWHSAARATADDTTRRHVRGGYYGGEQASAPVAGVHLVASNDVAVDDGGEVAGGRWRIRLALEGRSRRAYGAWTVKLGKSITLRSARLPGAITPRSLKPYIEAGAPGNRLVDLVP